METRGVLVVAPFPDDESIGCGGAVYLHRDCGDRVRVVILTLGRRGLREASEAHALREAEAERAGEVLRAALGGWMPEAVDPPHPAEVHMDRAAALSIVRAALAGRSARSRLLGYEVRTPPEWYDVVEEIGGVLAGEASGDALPGVAAAILSTRPCDAGPGVASGRHDGSGPLPSAS